MQMVWTGGRRAPGKDPRQYTIPYLTGTGRAIVSRMAIFKNNPYAGFNFTVVVEGAEPAAFSTVILPTVEIDVVEYRDGTDKTNQPRQVVGLTKYTNLVLRRGVVNSHDLWAW